MSVEYHQIKRYRGITGDAIDWTIIARRCRFKLQEMAASHIGMRCGMSLWSFGETIEVNLSRLDGELLVDIVSRSSIVATAEDWGKNARNVRRIFDELERSAGISPGNPVRICAACGYTLVQEGIGPCPECGASETVTKATTSFAIRTRGGLKIIAAITVLEFLLFGGLRLAGVAEPFALGGFATPWRFSALVVLNAGIVVAIELLGLLFRRR